MGGSSVSLFSLAHLYLLISQTSASHLSIGLHHLFINSHKPLLLCLLVCGCVQAEVRGQLCRVSSFPSMDPKDERGWPGMILLSLYPESHLAFPKAISHNIHLNGSSTHADPSIPLCIWRGLPTHPLVNIRIILSTRLPLHLSLSHARSFEGLDRLNRFTLEPPPPHSSPNAQI